MLIYCGVTGCMVFKSLPPVPVDGGGDTYTKFVRVHKSHTCIPTAPATTLIVNSYVE